MMKERICIEIMDEGTTYDCNVSKGLDDVADCIIEEYERHEDLTLNETLEKIELHGLCVLDVIEVFKIVNKKFAKL